MTTIKINPLIGYKFDTKDAQPEEDASIATRLNRLKEDFAEKGCRTSVEGVLLAHENNHPHILMLQIANSYFKLPGDPVKEGESEKDALKRILTEKLSPAGVEDHDWEIGDLLGIWYRPNFEAFVYPYKLPHIEYPKEMKKVYMVHIPEKKLLAIPKNMKLLAVPVFDLYDNSQRYGPQLAGLPHLLSRFQFSYK